ncbi:polysaccharide pyruvyl transferase family protein [Pseudidiomarina donghaiensis]|uniref:polysaccharide pyruvyl transferase family protein n=1 Tax=Pseudidiomarina donghaiensis TaxID=519452 RepID=UPI003A986A67
MKKIVIVSTYPEKGSMNIGDQLITDTLIENISYVAKQKKIEFEIEVVFRADTWEEVKGSLINSDFIVFACLAIRPRMSEIEYPYLSKLIELNKPFGVVAAGTSLPVTSIHGNLLASFSQDTIALLRKIAAQSSFFTTRGVLTHSLCKEIGLEKIFFSGDIAFYSEYTQIKKFKSVDNVENISISSPHNPKEYESSLESLVTGIKKLFPRSNVRLVQHGVSDFFREFTEKHNIELVEAYKDKKFGLRIYDNTDLHVGYRVHAHVSSLKRKIPSYLLEQDGRGTDYGLTLDVKCTVPNYAESFNFIDFVKNPSHIKLTSRLKVVSAMPAQLILSMIDADKNSNFTKFLALESQVNWFSTNHSSYLSSIFEG